jgi:hypothetical protein
MKNRWIALGLAGMTMLGVVGCYRHEYNDRYGHPYHHRRWHNEEVYQREDGRWYAHRNNDWVHVEADFR